MEALSDDATSERVDVALFRHVVSHFCSGVVVLTATTRSGPAGLTCQSFLSLSLDPPLVLFSVARSSHSWSLIRESGCVAVNILHAGQRAESQAFAASGTDKFAGRAWRLGAHGAPLLTGALAHVQCRLEAVHDGGDHEVGIARVLAVEASSERRDPLLYYRSEYCGIGDRMTAD
ncbi:flavin reductase family protein [Symbioplanes lichenis]|uniref:flavin reductase family protein n=1 Tax=Symbioplanes lichenis TaxID=1629072 RepID=UPI0027387C32|nr:flavin reductase family protein [Actinoplanes lichenis]